MYSIQAVTKENYPILEGWWKAHNWPVIPLDHLPKTGYIVYEQGNPTIAGFAYKTDSAFCLFEFIVANPLIKGLRRDIAFSLLTDAVVKYCMGVGAKTLFISASNANLIAKLEKNGFTKTDLNMTNMIRRLV